MIKTIKNNKILFIVTAIVLLCGACLSVLLISSADAAQAAQQIKTAEAEAAEQLAHTSETIQPAQAAEPSATPGQLSAQELQSLVSQREMRRDYIIPVIDTVFITEAKTWKQITPKNNDNIKAAAYEKSAQIAKGLFGYEMGGDYSFLYYTDTSKHRADVVQIKTEDDAIVCTLTADELELINIDYYFIPKGEPRDLDKMYDYFPQDIRLIADNITAMFGTKVSNLNFAGGGGSNELTWTVYSINADNGMFIKFADSNSELAAVSVYPSEASMMECVYFDADVQHDPSIVHLVSPTDFKEGEPGKGDMTKDEAKNMYVSFLNLANGTAKYAPSDMKFYIDHSGKRENYWHIEGALMTMDIASKSKWIVSLTCDDLWNPEYDLTGIDYGSMGGSEYEAYLRNIMSSIYGDGLAKVSGNAVYDYHYCTEDAWMTDGTVYEFMFEDGNLQNVFYTFDDDYFGDVGYGWKADFVFINSVTGEEFITQ